VQEYVDPTLDKDVEFRRMIAFPEEEGALTYSTFLPQLGDLLCLRQGKVFEEGTPFQDLCHALRPSQFPDSSVEPLMYHPGSSSRVRLTPSEDAPSFVRYGSIYSLDGSIHRPKGRDWRGAIEDQSWRKGDFLPKPLISVVIPARDEEGRIGSAIAAVDTFLTAGGFSPEIVVVDDGSRDQTAQEAVQAGTGRNVRLLTHAHPQGKGAAIVSGLRVSAGELVGFIDADLEYPAEALPQMAQMIYETGRETACVVAVRTRDERHKLDSVTSRVGRWVARLLLQLGVSDTQAGLKMFPGWFAREVLSTCKEARWLFDVEALVLAAEHHLSILEIPVAQRCVRRRRTGVVDMIECTLPLLRYAARLHSSRRQWRRIAPS
jgi:hypothetical protein